MVLVEGPSGLLAAWETEGQVYFGRVDPETLCVPQPVAAPGVGRGRKHPVPAVNPRGEVLFAWTEGTGWQRGGDLVWQRYAANGQPLGTLDRKPGAIAVWGLPATLATSDGDFLLYH